MFTPSEEIVDAVRDCLVAFGIKDDSIVHSENKGWLALDIPAWQAENLFNTEYHEHVHSTSGQVRVGCDEYVSFCERLSACTYHCLDAIFHLIVEVMSTTSRPVSNFQQY
jgi:hypothetical protein